MINSSEADASLPVGSVIAFAGNETHLQRLEGWFPCDGRELKNLLFPELFAAIRYANGGDGSTSFRLPDYRGYFLRGVDQGTGRDPDVNKRKPPASLGNAGDNPGSIQSYATGMPSKPFVLTVSHLPTRSEIGNLGSLSLNIMARWNSGFVDLQFRGGSLETRPVNKYVYFIIKADFAALFAVIGFANGGSSADGKFFLPDYRGRFLRGTNYGTGWDPDAADRISMNPSGNKGDAVGSIQSYDTMTPDIPFEIDIPHLPTASSPSAATAVGADISHWHGGDNDLDFGGGDQESRPLNAYVLFYIKYRD